MRAPTKRNSVSNLFSTGVSAPIATNVGNATDLEFHIAAGNAFDIKFSDDGTDVITGLTGATLTYALREVYTFPLSPKNTHFRLAVPSNTAVKYWITQK